MHHVFAKCTWDKLFSCLISHYPIIHLAWRPIYGYYSTSPGKAPDLVRFVPDLVGSVPAKAIWCTIGSEVCQFGPGDFEKNIKHKKFVYLAQSLGQVWTKIFKLAQKQKLRGNTAGRDFRVFLSGNYIWSFYSCFMNVFCEESMWAFKFCCEVNL